MNFFLTGLPRSRTAWLANLFTTGPVFCWHDALKDRATVRSLVAKARDARRTFGGITHVGDSDSGAVFFTAELLDAFPEAKWVFVHRAFEDCYNSFRKQFPTVSVSREAFAVAEDRLHEATALVPESNQIVIDFDDLEKIETVKAVWQFCVPSEPFSAHRWSLLNSFRINVIAEKAYRGLI